MLHITSQERHPPLTTFTYAQIENESGIYRSIEYEYTHLRFISNGSDLVIYVNISDGVFWGRTTEDNKKLTFIKVNESITFE